ncbi:MFS transporter [Ramlibacter tataouinensis]|uniref:Tartrate transporter (Phthalate transporter family)-like protein n=1 Tax=Ramlibacter tataouinensis (strain ATCC BAA-407 / DSM 14655 / LMG 21543 / TTB310) TaxID=365046 RepID=F5Y0T0_RAMTT|nr:MFS transporter [Ramlibacter tataouinensis]AEG94674.1 tartrate transporter (phthalate transporter family)-like protein [Ramlibacter tataouinensis TTB310]
MNNETAGQLPLNRLLNRVALRYLPFLLVCFIVSIIDRVNVGFAKMQMQQALEFSDVVFGLGAGIFFIGYFLFEVPSNMILARVGARRWIARILMIWGPIAAATAFVETPTQFYVLRFLLGVGEAGLFPGVVLLLTYWFPVARRTRYMALFMLAIPISGIIIGPLSAVIVVGLGGAAGLAGWQWLFIVQGLPALGFGFIALLILDDKPAVAKWLTDSERALLQGAVGEVRRPPPWREELRIALKEPGIWAPTLCSFFLIATAVSVGIWGPQFMQDLLRTDLRGIGATYAGISLAATIGMVAIAAMVDATGQRERALLILLATGAAAFLLAAFTTTRPLIAVLAIGVGAVCYQASFPVFWGCVTPRLGAAGAAAAIALINSVGNLGGALGPSIMGPVKQNFGLGPSIAVFGGFLLLSMLFVLPMLRGASASETVG